MNQKYLSIAVVAISVAGNLLAEDRLPSEMAIRFNGVYKVPQCLAELDGNKCWLVLDTGASASGLIHEHDRPHILSARVGEPFSSKSSAGTLAGVRYQGIPVSVPLFLLKNDSTSLLAVPVRDPSSVPADAAGVIGMDIIRKSQLRLRLSDSLIKVGYDSATDESAGQWHRLLYINDCPILPVLTDVRRFGDFLLDTGSFETAGLTKPLIDRLLRSGMAIADGQVVSRTVYDVCEVQRVRIRRLEIHGVVFENLPVTESRINHIGRGLLRRFDITLDFPRNRYRIIPNPGAADIDVRPDAGGIAVAPERLQEGGFSIGYLVPDRPGILAGLKVGDVLTAIDDKQCQDMEDFTAVYKAFKEDGRTCRLSILRDGQPLTVMVTLKWEKPFPPQWPDPVEQAPLLPEIPDESASPVPAKPGK